MPATFSYRNKLEWTGDRRGILSASEKPEIVVSSPPEFKGQSGLWTPEDLFVAAVNLCTMLTFLALAQKAQLAIADYRSEAEGALEFLDGRYVFSKVVIHPRVLIGDAAQLAEAREVLKMAHKKCLISNSIRASVLMEPEISLKTTPFL